jgi:ATP-dependent RNA helicase DbpA
MDFKSLSLAPELLEVVMSMGFTQMTPVQAACIPLLLKGRDIVGQSQTGSGKTAAFALPILQNIRLDQRSPQALILCPTRELCAQVLREVRKFSKALTGLQVVALVGGQPYRPQIQALEQGVHVIVATPGRMLEHMGDNNVDFRYLKTLVLDEADRMLDIGFEREMMEILERLPGDRQTVFFSATFPDSIADMSHKYQKNPERITIESPETAPMIDQYLYIAEKPEKIETLRRILKQHPSSSTVIFCRMKTTVAEIAQILLDEGASCVALHGDLEQVERDRVMATFRNGSRRILVATDVAARGLDIENLELVVNFDWPSSEEMYIHRIGRTGRAGRKGAAVSIATSYEIPKAEEMERITGVPMIKEALGFEGDLALADELKSAPNETLVISGGRLDKLRPGDILGFLTAEPQALVFGDIGKIEIHDRFSYVAIKSALANQALAKIQAGRIKKLKFKVFLV